MKVEYAFFGKFGRTGRSLSSFEYTASVMELTTTGFLWWKKGHTRERRIKRTYAGSWYFADDGVTCPLVEFAQLERAYRAKMNLPDRSTENQ